MKTSSNDDLLEHFDNIEIKNWDLHQHNIGLKPTARYKQKLWIKSAGTITFYDENWKVMGTVTGTGSTNLSPMGVFSPSANRGVFVEHNTSTIATISIVDIKNMTLITTINESPSGQVSIEIDRLGNVYSFNKNTRVLKKYDKNGVLLKTFAALPGASSSVGGVFWNEKRKTFWLSAGTNASNGFYDKDLVAKLTGVTAIPSVEGQSRADFLSGDRIVNTQGDYSVISQYNFSTNPISLVSTSGSLSLRTVNSGGWRHNLLGEINGVVYYQSVLGGNTTYLVAIDKSLNITHKEVPQFNVEILGVDKKYVYASSATALLIFNLSDMSLHITVSNSSKQTIGGTTNGKWVNFSEYM